MLDKDLAELFRVRPIRLREQVRRNQARFPSKFMFRLSRNETKIMVSQFAIPSIQHLGGHRPLAFTEHGVLMLANVLRSEQAIRMSIRIIEIFMRVRDAILGNKDILLKLEHLEKKSLRHDGDIHLIYKYLKGLLLRKERPLQRIGFKQAARN